MSDDLKNKTVCVYDHGLFATWATKMTEYFGRVLYFCPWKNAFPQSNLFMIGQGLPEVEHVVDFFDIIEETDVFLFPDVYDGDLQCHLRDLGKPVWGSAKGEELELYRWESKQLLKKLGLPVQPVARIIGLDNLREHLMENDKKYVKVSMLRGDMETFYHDNYELTEPRLDELEHRLGARKHQKEFIVEDAIDPATEIGFDGYCIDGKFPSQAIQGYEVKDMAFIGVVKDYDELPEEVQIVNEKLSDVLRDYQYRGFFSTEIRVGKDKKPYLTDPCCRAGAPPNELHQEIISNWGEIIWGGANGEVIQPEFAARYGVETLIHSSWADKNWQAVMMPESVERWVKLRNLTKLNNKWYVAPQSVGLPEIGAVVAIDDDLLEAIAKLQSYIKQVKGYTIDHQIGHILDAIEVIKEGEKRGMKFSNDKLPTTEEVAKVLNDEA